VNAFRMICHNPLKLSGQGDPVSIADLNTVTPRGRRRFYDDDTPRCPALRPAASVELGCPHFEQFIVFPCLESPSTIRWLAPRHRPCT
jgi:hypothetical protein